MKEFFFLYSPYLLLGIMIIGGLFSIFFTLFKKKKKESTFSKYWDREKLVRINFLRKVDPRKYGTV